MKLCMRFFILLIAMMFSINVSADFVPTTQPRSYILVDYDTNTLLTSRDEDKPYPIASVTKIMTMLICMEAIQSGKISMNDSVVASEYACSMGGSQIYLEPGEQMTVEELLKSVAVGSANDASVVLAEHVMGSESAFVEAMNQRAKSLGMKNTHFVNCNGLDEDNHYSSARDVAIMSAELLKHEKILPFLGIWMDTVRNGQFGLTNTNKLIRFYNGAIGIKTGSTSEAKYCLSSAARRDGLTLIAVVIGAETSNERFSIAKELLNYGFSNYKVETIIEKNSKYDNVSIIKGKKDFVQPVAENSFKRLVNKQTENKIEEKITLKDNIKAPVNKGDVVGKIELIENNNLIGEVNLVSSETVKKLDFADIFGLFVKSWMLK